MADQQMLLLKLFETERKVWQFFSFCGSGEWLNEGSIHINAYGTCTCQIGVTCLQLPIY
jgi:hypothetical protein